MLVSGSTNIANVILLPKYIQLMFIVIFFGRHFSKKLINSFRVSKDVIWTISNLFISRTNVSFLAPNFREGQPQLLYGRLLARPTGHRLAKFG